jgi:hypothetical protein
MRTTGNPTLRGQALVATWLLAGGSALAGGHFDVDDAGTLDPGQCQYEAWASRHRATGGEPVRGLHLGPACRVGPVELGVNIDRFSVRGERSTVVAGPQVKWTFFGQQAEAPLAAALSVSANFDVTHGGRTGGQFVVPVTWRATESLQLHANFGADWLPVTGARTGRGGLAVEWALYPHMSLIAERNRAFGLWTSRVGARFNLTPLISIDVSASRTGSGEERVRGVVIGLNHAFDWR